MQRGQDEIKSGSALYLAHFSNSYTINEGKAQTYSKILPGGVVGQVLLHEQLLVVVVSFVELL